MSPHIRQAPGTQPKRKRRLRLVRWFVLYPLAALMGLTILGNIVNPPKPADRAASAPATTTDPASTTAAPTTTTTATTTATAAPVVTVGQVLDGDTVTLQSDGGTVTARLLGIDTPATRDPGGKTGCFGPEATAWATNVLAGKQVVVRTDPTQGFRDEAGNVLVYLTLPDGTDYSIEAVRQGYARYAAPGIPPAESAALQAGQDDARGAGRGLWGAPCFGNTDPPSTVIAPPAPQPQPQPKAAPAPQPTPRPAPVPEPETRQAPPPPPAGGEVYYRNCAEARAAGAAPIYRGQPGYRPGLDRDNDGVACE
jgi:endonuclease YncB( thermonuclease family)